MKIHNNGKILTNRPTSTMKEIRVVDVETEKRHVNEYHRLFMSKQITFPVIKMAFGWTSHCKHMETKTRDSCFIAVSLE